MSPGLWKPRAISALIPSWAAGRPSEAMHASHPAPNSTSGLSESHSSARSRAQIVSQEAALGAWGPTKVGTRPPSTWRIVQSEIAAKDLLLLVVGAALRRRRLHEC